jgi:hypothetical protein
MSIKVKIWLERNTNPHASTTKPRMQHQEGVLASPHTIAQLDIIVPPVGGPQMNTRIIASLITAAMLAACSSPTVLNLEDLGAQPTLEELNADNDSSLELSGTTGGLGNLLIRKIYDVNQNGRYDAGDQGIPAWGMRIVSVDESGNPDDAADVQVTPWGSERWRGVNLKVPYGRYKIEELEPSATQVEGTAWKVTGKPARIVNVTRSNPLRAIEFAGVCLENSAVVPFPKLEDFRDWKCKGYFKLFPRIDSFTATPDSIQSGASTTLNWNVLDYSKLEIVPLVGEVTGFKGSKVVTPTTETAYQLRATNGFGTSTASVRVYVNSGASGKWSTVGNLQFATGEMNQVFALGSDRFVLTNGAGKRELYDFKTGTSKELKQFQSGIVRPSDQKIVGLVDPSGVILSAYDPNTDSSSTVSIPFAGGFTPITQLQGDTFLATNSNPASTNLAFGLLDLGTYTYSKTAEFQVVFDGPGTPIATAFIALTQEKNALFVSTQYGASGVVEARAILVNPRTGQTLSNTKMLDPFCFFISAGFSGVVSTFGPTVTLGNGHLLRVGGISFRGGATSAFCEYDPASQTIVKEDQANQLSQGKPFLLGNGQVLAMKNSAQAVNSNNPFDADFQADLYDPNSKTFTFTSPFVQGRRYSKAAQLSDGRVVVFAGLKPRSPLESTTTPAAPLSSIEVYTP